MSTSPRTYADLSAEEQAAFSVWIDTFEQTFPYEGMAALKEAIAQAPYELRVPLAAELLPPLIDHLRQQHRRTPTLHELRARFPDLAALLTAAYAFLPAHYQLPVELRGYRILQVVGEGGQAFVLRAQDDVHSAVAIKLSASTTHNEYVLRERKLLGQCQHAGIPEVIASGVIQDRAYFIMPFLRGMTLADKFATHRPSVEETVRIGADLCGIVAHLHARGIVHRDIKPQNIWIDESGAVKLIDLGMAIDRSNWGAPQSSIEEFHGTPAFMSPEQAAADGETDGELSDVYSIGAILYWMMTGAAPFAASTAERSLQLAKDGTVDFAKLAKLSGYPKVLKLACRRAMAPRSELRIPSAEALASLIKDSQTSQKPLRAMAALILLLVILGGVIYWPWQNELPRPTQKETNPPEMLAKPTVVSAVKPRAEERPLEDQPEPTLIPEQATPARTEPKLKEPAEKSPQLKLERKNFFITFSSILRHQKPFGDRPEDARELGVLQVRPQIDQEKLPGRIEYRIDDLPWRPLMPSGRKGEVCAFLNKTEAVKDGPVELRIVDDTGAPLSVAEAPLTYPYNIKQQIKRENDFFVKSLLDYAASARCMDRTATGWTVDQEYSDRYTSAVRDLLYTNDQHKPMRSVARQVATILGPDDPEGPGRPSYSLKQAFALVRNDVRSAPKIWVKLELRDGKMTNPVEYTPAKLAAEKRLERATKPFRWLGPEQDAAIFAGERLKIFGLERVLPEITHLQLVGEYHAEVTEGGEPLKNHPNIRKSSKLTFDVSKLAGKRVFQLPPIWSSVTIRGRLSNGKLTPGYTARNQSVYCGREFHPVASSSSAFAVEAYVYIAHDQLPVEDLSVSRHLPNASSLSPFVAQSCRRTRLKLFSMLPEGATDATFYSDREFRKPITTCLPGFIFTKYTDSEGNVVGHTTYQIKPPDFNEWVEHALSHVKQWQPPSS